jgi:hypothetical protein
MPITYDLDRANRLIVTRCVGETDLREVIRHFEELVNLPDPPPSLDVLLDLSEMTTIPDSTQLHSAATATAKASEHIRFDHCAIVTSSEPVRGLALVWVMFAQQSFRATEVFRTFEEARGWLASSRVHD